MDGKKIFVVAGLAFGDEGKGSYTDFLTKEYDIKTLVRYAGGNQSNRTVTLNNGKKIEFSQLSAGMARKDAHTYITKNVVISLDDLIAEVNDLAVLNEEDAKDVLQRVHINKDCIVVTPYHKLINHLNEIIAGDKRRGSVGLGSSEAKYLADYFNIAIRFGDLICSREKFECFKKLYDYAVRLYNEVSEKTLNKLPENIVYLIEKEAEDLLNEKALNLIIRRETNMALALSKTIYESDYDVLAKNESIMFEGSLGLLIDRDFGIKPNTSLTDTSNLYPRKLLSDEEATYFGITRSYYQRHGRGVFPTESGFLRKTLSNDEDKEGYWNGKVRYGWFDSVLFKYACDKTNVDEIFVSSLDSLSVLKEIKICDYYFYNGDIDDEFVNTFDFEISDDKILIHKIKNIYSSQVTAYLKKCKPHYITIKGWNCDISRATTYDELPPKCKGYIRLIEKISSKNITYVSIGPTNNSKINIPKNDDKK